MRHEVTSHSAEVPWYSKNCSNEGAHHVGDYRSLEPIRTDTTLDLSQMTEKVDVAACCVAIYASARGRCCLRRCWEFYVDSTPPRSQTSHSTEHSAAIVPDARSRSI